MVACPGARHEQEAAQFLKMNADVRVLSELADGCLDGTLYVSIQLCIFRQKTLCNRQARHQLLSLRPLAAVSDR